MTQYVLPNPTSAITKQKANIWLPPDNWERRALAPPPSRFERQVWVGNWLDEIQAASKRTAVVVANQPTVIGYQQRRLGYHGDVKRGDMYQIHVSFALTGDQTYSEPLPSVEPNRDYQIRMSLGQYQATPLVMGWALEWSLPIGWIWLDGLPSVTYEEFVSNPMVVTRVVRSPANPVPAGFQIVPIAKYA